MNITKKNILNSKSFIKIARKTTILLVMKCGFLCTMISPSFAYSAVELRQLKNFDPQTRLEQACDIAVMNEIEKQSRLSPDKVLAYAFGDFTTVKDRIIAPKAAVRSRNNWYHLSYDCLTKANHIDIVSIKFKIGNLVPRADWEKHYLVP